MPDASQRGRQIVTLVLNGELYGLGIEFVQRALPPQPVTPVPQMPEAVRGVMNLRGQILPVIDLRARLGLPPLTADRQAKTRFLIVEADGRGAALIADTVAEVRGLPDTSSEEPHVRMLDIRETLSVVAWAK